MTCGRGRDLQAWPSTPAALSLPAVSSPDACGIHGPGHGTRPPPTAYVGLDTRARPRLTGRARAQPSADRHGRTGWAPSVLGRGFVVSERFGVAQALSLRRSVSTT